MINNLEKINRSLTSEEIKTLLANNIKCRIECSKYDYYESEELREIKTARLNEVLSWINRNEESEERKDSVGEINYSFEIPKMSNEEMKKFANELNATIQDIHYIAVRECNEKDKSRKLLEQVIRDLKMLDKRSKERQLGYPEYMLSRK